MSAIRRLLRLRRSILVLLPPLALLAALLALGGCGRTPQTEVVPLDLLSLSPPALGPLGEAPPAASRRRWDFEDGLPEGWRAGPPGVKVVSSPEGIRLEAPDPPEEDPPWLEIDVDADPLHYGQLTALLTPLTASEAEIYCSFTLPARYSPTSRALVSLVEPGRSKAYRFQLPKPEAAEGPVKAIRLYPGGRQGGGVIVKRVVLLPRSRDSLGTEILAAEQVELRQEYRRCWRLAGSGAQEVSFRVPQRGARLSLALGTLLAAGPGRLRAEVRTEEGESSVVLDESFPAEGEGWVERSAGLEPWADRQLTLRLEVESADPLSLRLLGSPVVLADAEEQRPGVLVILVDTLRADRLSAYGHPVRTSPHLARFARRGVLYSRVVAPASWTLPSVASLYTGRYPGEMGIRGEGEVRIPNDAPTAAERFARAGYHTAAFIANSLLIPEMGYARGFGTYYLAPYSGLDLSAEEVNRKALGWIRAHRGEQFFCYLHYLDPHAPYTESLTGRPVAGKEGEFRIGEFNGWPQGGLIRLLMGWEKLRGPQDLDRIQGFYDEAVAYTDLALGRLFASLEREGLLDELVVVVTADHGEELHDHGYWSHGYTLYEEVLRVPLILRAPGAGVPAGRVVHRPVSLVDVLPTLETLAGIAPPGEAGGSGGRGLLGDGGERLLYSETWAGKAPRRFSVIDGRFKYVFFDRAAAEGQPPTTHFARHLLRHGPAAEELYDLEEDPLERTNLLAERPETAARLQGEMARWFAERNKETGGRKEGSGPADADMEARLRALGYIQ